MLSKKRVVLASASPRRKELMKLISDDFEIIPAESEENSAGEADVRRVPEYLAFHKCREVASGCDPDENTVVIGCDTVVVFEGRIFGKPADESDAMRMLCALSGGEHEVISGVSVFYRGEYRNFSVSSSVGFYELSIAEIEEYIKSGEPFGKAGGYAVQGLAGIFVREVRGDFNNVVGLPVSRLARELTAILKSKG